MIKSPSQRHVVMAKDLAKRWLFEVAQTEHRISIYCTGKDVWRLPSLLRGFRDGKFRIGTVSSIPDLGILESFDSVTVWSSDREALLKLAQFFEGRGYETTGIW